MELWHSVTQVCLLFCTGVKFGFLL